MNTKINVRKYELYVNNCLIVNIIIRIFVENPIPL